MVQGAFDRNGVHRYPARSAFINQSKVVQGMQDFLDSNYDQETRNMFIYGDWGSGKTRVGHQLISEVTDGEYGWEIKQDGDYSEQFLLKDHDETILPLPTTLSAVAQFDTHNAGVRIINNAVERFIDGEKQIYKDLQEYFSDDCNGDIAQLDSIRTTTTSSTEKLERYLSNIVDESDVDRILLVLDEVEEAGNIGSQTPDDITLEGAGSQRLRTLFEGLKQAVNPGEENYPERFPVYFLLLCSSGVKRFEDATGGLDRRRWRRELQRPTVEDVVEYTESVLEEIEGPMPSRECISALFFASFNNFGWYSRTMAAYLQLKQQNPGMSYYRILRNNKNLFSDIFNESYIERIEGESNQELISQVLDVVYRLRPVKCKDLSLDEISVDELYEYKTPTQESALSEVSAVPLSPSDVIKQIGERDAVKPADGEGQFRIQSDTFSVDRLMDILEVLRINDEYLGIYSNEDDITELCDLMFSRRISSTTVSELTNAFAEIAAEHGTSDEYIAPSMSFLQNWIIRWIKMESRVRWLSDEEQWEELVMAARSPSDPDHRLLKGFLNLRANAYDENATELDIDPYSGARGPLDCHNVTGSIGDRTGFDFVESDQVFAVKHTTKQDTLDTLRDIKEDSEGEYPLVYLLFESDSIRDDIMEDIQSSLARFQQFVFPHVIKEQSTEYDFLVRFSFLHEDSEGGFIPRDIRDYAREEIDTLNAEFSKVDQERRDELGKQGWIIRQISPPDTGDSKYLAHAVRAAVSGDSIRNHDNEAVSRAVTRANNTADELAQLVTLEGELRLPPFVPKMLSVLDSDGPLSVSDIAGRFLFDSSLGNDTTTEHSLTFLEELGVISQTASGYLFNDLEYLRDERLHETEIKAPHNVDSFTSDYVWQPDSGVLAHLRLNKPSLDQYKDDLDEAKDDVENVEFEKLLDSSTDPDEWYEQASTVNQIRIVAKKGYDPSNEFSPDGMFGNDLEQIKEEFEKLRSSDLAEYGLTYRKEFLDGLEEALDDISDEITSLVEERKDEIDDEYESVDGHSFPTSPMMTGWEAIESEAEFEDASLPNELVDTDAGAVTNQSIPTHLKRSEFKDAFNRFQWYSGMLGGAQSGPWTRFTNAFDLTSDALDRIEDVKQEWNEAMDYFQDVPKYIGDLKSEDFDISVSEEESEAITGEDCLRALNEFEDHLTLDDGSTIELKQSAQLIDVYLTGLSDHISSVRKEANEEISEKRENLENELEPLQRLAQVTGESIGINTSEIDKQDTFQDKFDLIEEQRSSIDERGREIFKEFSSSGSETYWGRYKKLYENMSDSDTSTISEDLIKSSHLDQLDDWGVISIEDRLYEVNLK